MKTSLIQAFLEAYAVGDAFGKATEYCSQKEIESAYPAVTELLSPEKALTHKELCHGQVTDDTEQNVYLIGEYARKLAITPYDTAMCLLRWVQETDAATKYIGPNSLKALCAIRDGADVTEAGKSGTTCGGMMRAPAAVFFSTPENLVQHVVNCLMPTHYTSVAIEAAVCYAYAMQAALRGESMAGIFDAACQGAEIGKAYGSNFRTAGVAPSCAGRLRFLQQLIPGMKSAQEVKKFLYEIVGATLASYDVCACAFAIFLYAGKDVMLAIRMATEMGGDTDTIACLAAGLSTLYAGGHNLPEEMVTLVAGANHLDFNALASDIAKARNVMYGEELL